jgi:hypothetical protein
LTRERLRPRRAEDEQIRGEASASVRAGGGAPAPVKKRCHGHFKSEPRGGLLSKVDRRFDRRGIDVDVLRVLRVLVFFVIFVVAFCSRRTSRWNAKDAKKERYFLRGLRGLCVRSFHGAGGKLRLRSVEVWTMILGYARTQTADSPAGAGPHCPGSKAGPRRGTSRTAIRVSREPGRSPDAHRTAAPRPATFIVQNRAPLKVREGRLVGWVGEVTRSWWRKRSRRPAGTNRVYPNDQRQFASND